MLVNTTYPKSSSRSCVDFAESQISVFYFSIFEAKTIAQKYIHIWRKFSSCYTEHKKIEFSIFGFLYYFLSILQVSANT
jgi:hypothetical protein